MFIFFIIFISLNFFRQEIRDFSSYTIYNENWEILEGVKFSYNYSWIENKNRPIYIAHALGYSGEKFENSIFGYKLSKISGFDFFEVDLWLDSNNNLRCHHGPEQPPPISSGQCTFGNLLKLACLDKSFLILDIKTDFLLTTKEIEKFLHKDCSRFVIFQLYKSNDFFIFDEISKKFELPGPIYTYYMTRRNIDKVINVLSKTGVRAVAFPTSIEFNKSSYYKNISFFVHPVYNCTDFMKVDDYGFVGLFTKNKFFTSEVKKCHAE